MFKGMNVIAVVVAAFFLLLLRFAWYAYFAGTGLDALPLQLIDNLQADWVVTAMGVVNAVILASGLVWLIGQTGDRSALGGLLAGFAGFFLFSLTAVLQPYIYGGQLSGLEAPSALLVDAGHALASYVGAGLILGLLIRRRRSSASAERAKMFAAEH
jgi:hypothetical protein